MVIIVQTQGPYNLPCIKKMNVFDQTKTFDPPAHFISELCLYYNYEKSKRVIHDGRVML